MANFPSWRPHEETSSAPDGWAGATRPVAAPCPCAMPRGRNTASSGPFSPGKETRSMGKKRSKKKKGSRTRTAVDLAAAGVGIASLVLGALNQLREGKEK